MWGDKEPNGQQSSYSDGLREHRQIVLRGYARNSSLDNPTIIDEDAEDICLTSDGWQAKLEGAWGNSRGNWGNLVLNKEEKKKEVQDGRPLHIKCTATI